MMENNVTGGNTRANIFSEAALLTIVPAISYWASFQYESGFLSFFEVPNDLVKISLESLFLSVGVLLIIVLILASFFDSAFRIIPKEKHAKVYLFTPLALYIVLALLVITYCQSLIAMLAILSVTGIFVLPFYCIALWPIRNTHYTERLLFLTRGQHTNGESLYKKLCRFGGGIYLAALLSALLTVAAAYGLGYIAAETKRDFFVTEFDSGSYALIREYNDTAIYIKVTAPTKDIQDQVYAVQKGAILLSELASQKPHTLERIPRSP